MKKMKTIGRHLLTLLISLSLSVYVTELSAQSAAVDESGSPDFFEGMKWRNIGPNRGGRSLGISGSPQRKQEYYFGAVGGGLWKTIDGGLNWNPVTDGQLNSSSVGAVAVSETNPDIVYIGTGETQLRGNIMQGDGVYKSTDAGKTWKNIGLKETQAIARVRVHPTNPDIVYVAALGHPYGPNEERGIFKTEDGGDTWKKVLYKSDQAGGVDLIIDRTNPEVVYASLWQVYRTPWKMWGGGGDSGLFKSTDGGDTWTELTRKPGMPEGTVGKIGVTVSPVDPNRVWAIVEADSGGVYRSDDAGMNWKRVNDERKLRQRAFYYSRLYADPLDKDGVYGLNVGFYKSTDGGVTFDKVIDVPHGDNHDLWIDPTDSTRLAASNDGGGTISTNGGESWTDEDFPTSQLYHIMVTNDFPYHVAGAQQDNSTLAIPNEGWDHMLARQNTNKTLNWFYPVGGGESGYIAQDPKDPDIFYAGSQGALLTRYNRMTGQIRDVQVYPRFFSGEPSSALPERWQWTFPIVFSPLDPNRLYTCSQHVWMTTDEGQSWEKISPDLTLADTATLGLSGGVLTKDMNGPEIYATVFALAPSFHDVNTIWAGSDDGLVHITRDHGANWENITPPDMPEHTRVSIIDASRHKPGTAYIAGKRYQMDDRAPYIWKTDDYGKTWKKIVSGIRGDDYIHSVREDITQPGLLYAGAEHGVWVSFNDGENWRPLQLDLPDTQIADLIVTENDLVIGTHGRSIYVLDDIAPIREYSEELANAAFHFFKPYPAVRDVQAAGLQYYLAEQADTIRIEIMDASGNVIRTFVGDQPKYEKKKETEPVYQGTEDKLPTTAAGLNRFEWDLRYPGATEFEGMIMWSARPTQGPMAPPGTYQVKITADGTSMTHPIEVKLDPRLEDVSEEDIQKQFQLAMAIRNKTSQANEAVIQIRKIKEKLAEQKNSKSTKVMAALSEVEEALYQVKNQSRQDPLNFPIKLNNRLSSLRRSVENGNAKPTDAAYVVFEELSEELDQHMATLDKIMSDKTIDRLGI
ncbi:MAG: glycosyl hydrolase [Cyclobacteriaceae bacterium]